MLDREADLGFLEPVDEAVVLVVALGLPRAGQPRFELALEPGQLVAIRTLLRPPDGGLELVEQMAQVLFHGVKPTGRGACTGCGGAGPPRRRGASCGRSRSR